MNRTTNDYQFGYPLSGDLGVRGRGMTDQTARWLYDTLRSAILMVAVGIALATMLGAFDGPMGNGLPEGAPIQGGIVIQGHQPGNFNDDAHIDTSQVDAK